MISCHHIAIFMYRFKTKLLPLLIKNLFNEVSEVIGIIQDLLQNSLHTSLK